MTVPELRTPRLRLRAWCAADLEPFRALNADSEVMRHFPNVLTAAESDAMGGRIAAHFLQHGFGLWAVEAPGIAPFLGFVGLAVVGFEAHFTPCVEVSWRVAREHWGHGYATEAGRAALEFGFERLGLEEIVAFTVPDNVASRRVMERLGMHHDRAGDFDHPKIPPGHRMRRHVLYRLPTSINSHPLAPRSPPQVP